MPLNFFLNYLFSWFSWICAVLGLSLVMVSVGLLFSCGVWSSHFGDFSCSGTWALERGLSGAWAQLSLGI